MKFSPLASYNATKDVLNNWGLSNKKSLGQHFLINDHVIGKILSLSEMKSGEEVLEIGPGIGTLSLALLNNGARLTVIEKDDDLIPLLKTNLPLDNVEIINCDALQINASELTQSKLIANLPYSVAATIVLKFFSEMKSLQSATVMVQNEVAQRFSAKPGTKNYGAYSVKLRLYADCAGSFTVKPSSFYPPPSVNSAVIRLDRSEIANNLSERTIQKTNSIIEAAFFQRRKKIRNSIIAYFDSKGINNVNVEKLLEDAKISSDIRAEQLDLSNFILLGELYAEKTVH